MEKTKKMIRNFIIFILLIILTFQLIFKDSNISEIFEIILNAKKGYIFIALIAMCFFVICDSINISRTLKALNERSTFIRNIKYSLIGSFYSGITPAASGGQPMQIYYMHKDSISVANATLTLLINLTSMQIVTISIAFISLFFNHNLLNSALIIFFIIGIGLNLSALSLLLIAIYSKKLLRKLINFVEKIMRKFKLKNVEEKIERLEEEVTIYQENCEFIKKNPKLLLKTVLTTYVQYLFFYSVSYWGYRALGLNECGIFKIITVQSLLFATVSGIPSPGAVGVTEGGFIEIFKSIIPENLIKSSILLNRGISFYLLMIIGGIVSLFAMFLTKKKLKKDDV